MKKLLMLILCLALSSGMSACMKKEEPVSPTNNTVNTEVVDDKDNEIKLEEEINSERTEETDRAEIENNIRDIKTLIEEELYDDAEMILEALKSRELTEEEKAEVAEIEKILAEVK